MFLNIDRATQALDSAVRKVLGAVATLARNTLLECIHKIKELKHKQYIEIQRAEAEAEAAAAHENAGDIDISTTPSTCSNDKTPSMFRSDAELSTHSNDIMPTISSSNTMPSITGIEPIAAVSLAPTPTASDCAVTTIIMQTIHHTHNTYLTQTNYITVHPAQLELPSATRLPVSHRIGDEQAGISDTHPVTLAVLFVILCAIIQWICCCSPCRRRKNMVEPSDDNSDVSPLKNLMIRLSLDDSTPSRPPSPVSSSSSDTSSSEEAPPEQLHDPAPQRALPQPTPALPPRRRAPAPQSVQEEEFRSSELEPVPEPVSEHDPSSSIQEVSSLGAAQERTSSSTLVPLYTANPRHERSQESGHEVEENSGIEGNEESNGELDESRGNETSRDFGEGVSPVQTTEEPLDEKARETKNEPGPRITSDLTEALPLPPSPVLHAYRRTPHPAAADEFVADNEPKNGPALNPVDEADPSSMNERPAKFFPRSKLEKFDFDLEQTVDEQTVDGQPIDEQTVEEQLDVRSSSTPNLDAVLPQVVRGSQSPPKAPAISTISTVFEPSRGLFQPISSATQDSLIATPTTATAPAPSREPVRSPTPISAPRPLNDECSPISPLEPRPFKSSSPFQTSSTSSARPLHETSSSPKSKFFSDGRRIEQASPRAPSPSPQTLSPATSASQVKAPDSNKTNTQATSPPRAPVSPSPQKLFSSMFTPQAKISGLAKDSRATLYSRTFTSARATTQPAIESLPHSLSQLAIESSQTEAHAPETSTHATSTDAPTAPTEPIAHLDINLSKDQDITATSSHAAGPLPIQRPSLERMVPRVDRREPLSELHQALMMANDRARANGERCLDETQVLRLATSEERLVVRGMLSDNLDNQLLSARLNEYNARMARFIEEVGNLESNRFKDLVSKHPNQ